MNPVTTISFAITMSRPNSLILGIGRDEERSLGAFATSEVATHGGLEDEAWMALLISPYPTSTALLIGLYHACLAPDPFLAFILLFMRNVRI
ncbi:hypothetical protein BDV23DRAFT_166617 [Aspergillus alliaceus]|uniref:Uncharacterized protein n=1 Tax=Petromyces alliaceus TaxID=209559 RepID=A0A5N7BRS1_PETAA|nr:hypothetical protein BDV23DRAFT_166617 [Aspergillus alliaceus]